MCVSRRRFGDGPRAAGSGNRLLECLSLVRGNSHAGFLEELGAGNGPQLTRQTDMDTTPTWNSAKHLLAEYDGAATEIFVVGLAPSQLRRVVAAISELTLLEVLSFEDKTLEPPEPFDSAWRSRLEAMPNRSCQHALRSANGTPRHLQLYLWSDPKTGTLEVEIVFWNDLTFPPNLDSEERERRLSALVSLAEACRSEARDARCILAPEHNGPTEELLERHHGHLVVW